MPTPVKARWSSKATLIARRLATKRSAKRGSRKSPSASGPSLSGPKRLANSAAAEQPNRRPSPRRSQNSSSCARAACASLRSQRCRFEHDPQTQMFDWLGGSPSSTSPVIRGSITKESPPSSRSTTRLPIRSTAEMISTGHPPPQSRKIGRHENRLAIATSAVRLAAIRAPTTD